ncbi:MAG: hypothetical protein AAGF85_15675 [Bacteroidota bacterium]
MKCFSWSLVVIIITIGSVNAQKVKYKDLYPLLDSRQYELAIPLLKTFLADSKTSDHPNGNFQLAMYYEKMTLEQDVLKSAEDMALYADSAVASYQKTLTVLTEKEVTKKNSEYYGAYQRRDVRTGKVGIKLSDIQYDIEKKVNALTSRKVAVNNINVALANSYASYKISQRLYSKLRESYADTRKLYLQADERVLKILDTLATQVDLAIVDAGKMKTELGKIEKAGYDPKIVLRPVESYENDGLDTANYYSDEIVFWEYGDWAKEVEKKVNSEVMPMMSALVNYDNELADLKQRTLKDSVSVVNEIGEMTSLQNQLKVFDPDPLPTKVFDVKISELKYLSKLVEHHDYADSSDLIYITGILNEKVTALSEYDSLLNVLSSFPYHEEAVNYKPYLTQSFGDIETFEKYIQTNKEFADHQFEKKSLELQTMKERANWLISESDSIPLYKVSDVIISDKYLPVVVDSIYTAGLSFSDEGVVKGYFSLINKERTPEAKVEFNVNNEFFNRINILDIQAMINRDESGQIYHLMFYLPMPEQETYIAELCKIYTADGLAWEKSLTLDTGPSSLNIAAGTGDVEIIYDLDNYSGDKQLASGITLDKKGEVQNN